MNEIGNFVLEQTLQDVGSTKSPVTGKQFKKLSNSYRELKKEIASPLPNLELHGNMLDALEFKEKNTGVEIGIFDNQEAQKADNHNKFSAASKRTKVPARKFIPNSRSGERYRPDIRKEIVEIISENAKEGVSKTLINKMLGELNGR